MFFDPISGRILNDINKHAQQRIKEEGEKKQKSSYWVRCPNCGRTVVKKELISKKGCYLCGWQGTEDKIELAQIKHTSQVGKTDTPGEKVTSYKTVCPRCGARAITDEFLKEGCYICGYKPDK